MTHTGGNCYSLISSFYFLFKLFIITTSTLIIIYLYSQQAEDTNDKSKIKNNNFTFTEPNFIFRKNSKIVDAETKPSVNVKMARGKRIKKNVVKKSIPKTNVRQKTPALRTYLDLEKKYSLCQNGIQTIQHPQKHPCPLGGIVTVKQGGRLGNQIWEYISVSLVSKKTGLKPFVPGCLKQQLNKLFENLNLPDFESIRHCPLLNRNVTVASVKWPYDYKDTIILPKYNLNPKLLGERKNDIKNIFIIKKNLVDASQKILYSSLSFLKISAKSTFIGVHIRRTDYLRWLKITYNLQEADVKSFINSAMSYFLKKFANSIFIFVSDNPTWCYNNFHSKKNVYVVEYHHKTYPELDLAIMASCNHSIIDYGTFGQWGALLAGGETIFYPVHKKYSSEKLANNFHNWHSLK